MNVAALVSDLIFASRITGHGVPVRIARAADELDGADLVLIDLECPDAMDAIARCREQSSRIVAFGSHVRKDLLDAARAAGADEVLPRSAFVNRLREILTAAPSTE